MMLKRKRNNVKYEEVEDSHEEDINKNIININYTNNEKGEGKTELEQIEIYYKNKASNINSKHYKLLIFRIY